MYYILQSCPVKTSDSNTQTEVTGDCFNHNTTNYSKENIYFKLCFSPELKKFGHRTGLSNMNCSFFME